jgi:hypothetical protein
MRDDMRPQQRRQPRYSNQSIIPHLSIIRRIATEGISVGFGRERPEAAVAVGM